MKYVTLAGSTKWHEEIMARCRPGNRPGTLRSEDLCSVQVEHHQRGHKSATIWETIYGWALGYISNLDGREVIKGGRRQPGLSKLDVLKAGIEWANENPEFRTFEVLDTNLADIDMKELGC